MAQIIKNRRGSISNVKDVTTQNAEVLVASGSIGDLSGPFILYGSPTLSDSGLTGVYKPASKIYQGAAAPTILSASYGNVLDGTPFYAVGSNTLYILSSAGNTVMNLAGNLSGSILPNITASGSFSGSFQGNGSGLTNISASSVVGLNLNQIDSGSVTASVNIGPTTFQVVSGSTELFSVYNNGAVEYGLNTTASGSYSHAEGQFTYATGEGSHAEGSATITLGIFSHAEGIGTIASGSYQHVQGKYNIANTSSLMIIGNGTSDLSRSNIVDVKTNSVEVTGSLIVTNGITGSLLGTSSYAAQALSSSYALSASYSFNATSASYALNATSASYALNATTASYALSIPSDLNITASNVLINNNLVVIGTASFGYTKTVTGSAVIIGDSFIILNADTPTAPYAGIMVYDTGSNSTASFEWNGNNDYWISVEETGQSAGFLTGPSGSKGSEVFPSLNRVIKGTGNNTVVDTNITDTGTLVSINSNTQITGSLFVSAGITGSLLGTSSYADYATSASYALNATSASYALNATTASYALNATSASYALNATSASYVNILNQNVIISGSLTVTNSISTPVVNTPLVQNGSQQFAQDANTSITAIINGANTWGFYPGGQFYPAGPIAGSSYGSNQLILTNTSPAQLKGTIYGVQIVTSPDQEVTSSYTWDFKTNGDLVLPSGRYITGSLFGTASYAAEALTSSYALNATSASYALNATSASYVNILNQNVTISGSLNITNGVTGSLLGTASYAAQALSSSYALSASYSFNATTASYALDATTASYALNATTSSYALNATSASYALNATSASYVNILNQNVTISGSLNITNGVTGSLLGTASYAAEALTSSYALQATSASYALNASTASYVNTLFQNLVVSGAISSTGNISAPYLSGSLGIYDGSSAGVIQFSYMSAAKTLAYITPSQSGDLIQYSGSVMVASNLIDGGTF